MRGWFLGQWPTATLGRSIEILEALLEQLRQLHQFADEHAGAFRSQGLNDLCAVIAQDLPDDYFLLLQEHLARLKFPTGVAMTAELGIGGKSTNYVLRKTGSIKRTWRDFLGLPRPGELTYRLADRDEAGSRALGELKDRGLNLVADALAQSTDHILSFFTLLRWEMGFYVACLNLHDELVSRNLPAALPSPRRPGPRRRAFRRPRRGSARAHGSGSRPAPRRRTRPRRPRSKPVRKPARASP